MPTVNLNRKEFEKLVGKKLSLDKLKDRISMLGTDLEDMTDKDIIVEVFPDRPDMLSEQGFARAFSSFIGVKKGLREYKINKGSDKVIIESSVKDVRPYTTCAIVKNLKFNDEKIKQIIQIQEKLHIGLGRNRKKVAIGIYPFEKIKTPIYYKALEPGKIKFRPLEFKKELTGLQILSQHPAGRDYGCLLEGKKKFPIFIDSNNKILSMPPIINSHDTGKITEKTKDVFVECSGFDFESQMRCLNMIVTALSDMGGMVYSMELKYGNKKIITPDLKPEKMKLDVNYVNKILGLKLKEKDVKTYLESMGFGYKNKTAFIPAYRVDVIHPIDLVEDIAIAYGYENFKEEIPNVSTIGEEDSFEKFKNKVADILIGFGYLECNSYNLISEDVLDKMEVKLDNIKVLNPVNVEYDTLRSWMIPSLMKILSENKHYEFPQKIFEVGYVFGKEEFVRVGLLSCHASASFTEVKQVLDYLFNNLGLSYRLEEVEHGSFIKGRVGRVYCKEKKVGYIGEISPKVIENFSLEMPIVGFEVNLSEIFEIMK